MPAQFVDGWSIAQILGEGAFGEVKLLVNDETQDAVAVKTIDTKAHEEAKMAVKKEISIHRSLVHAHIIRYLGQRSEPGLEYIFLEYAAGGELFDRIEPDMGMKYSDAQKYFVQLVSAVDYLHNRGVAHRDIKPENILLSENDEVKLSDFGLATMFRKNGVERRLDKKCGTLPYVAPEVLVEPYYAAPADIWSCGVVLVTLLAGELPWDSPTMDCYEYSAWTENNNALSPWTKIETITLGLLRKILNPAPKKRPSTADILKHRWCVTTLKDYTAPRITSSSAAKRLNSGLEKTSDSDKFQDRLCATQPLPQPKNSDQIASNESVDYSLGLSFSQPTMLDDMLLSSQLHATQAANLNPYQRLVKRMTRFIVNLPHEPALERLTASLESLGCGCRSGPPSVVTVSTTDRRKMQLVFKVNLIEMSGNLLLDFRLSKGDGLEFKKLFLKTSEKLSDIIVKGAVLWPVLG